VTKSVTTSKLNNIKRFYINFLLDY